jgi:hypothetical protein
VSICFFRAVSEASGGGRGEGSSFQAVPGWIACWHHLAERHLPAGLGESENGHHEQMWIQVSSQGNGNRHPFDLRGLTKLQSSPHIYPNAPTSQAANRNSRKQTKNSREPGKIFAQMFFAVVRTSLDGFMRTIKEKAIKTFAGSSLEEIDQLLRGERG